MHLERAMPIFTYHHPLFGKVTYKTAHEEKVFGDRIIFTKGLNEKDIQYVTIPELKNIKNVSSTFLFHVKGHEQLKLAFSEIHSAGLIHIIKELGAPYYARLRKPTSGIYSSKPSNHAFGIALDINPNDEGNGISSSPLSNIFIKHGFTWGNTFTAKDPMHYEINEFIFQN